MGLEKDIALEKRHGAGRKGHGAGKRGMAWRHAKRGWGKHYAIPLGMCEHGHLGSVFALRSILSNHEG